MVDLQTFKREYGLILVGAIVFTASFLWRDLMADIKDMYFPKHRGIAGRTIFTILVTIILVVIAIYVRDFLRLNQPTVTKIEFTDPDPIDRDDNNNGTMSDVINELGMGTVPGDIDFDTTSDMGSDLGSDTGTDTTSG